MMRTTGSLWQRYRGRTPGLRVEVRVGAPREARNGLGPLTVVVEPVDFDRDKAEQALAQAVPRVLLSLQTYLQTQSTHEDQERYPFQQEVHLWPVGLDQNLGQLLVARALDISRRGMTLLLPARPPSEAVVIELLRPSTHQNVSAPARIVHVEAGKDGHEIEVVFGDGSGEMS